MGFRRLEPVRDKGLKGVGCRACDCRMSVGSASGSRSSHLARRPSISKLPKNPKTLLGIFQRLREGERCQGTSAQDRRLDAVVGLAGLGLGRMLGLEPFDAGFGGIGVGFRFVCALSNLNELGLGFQSFGLGVLGCRTLLVWQANLVACSSVSPLRNFAQHEFGF